MFSLRFCYPAKGIFLISVLSPTALLRTLTHETHSKIKSMLLERGSRRWSDVATFSAGYLERALLGLLSHLRLASPQHIKWIGLAFSELFPSVPQSVLNVLNGLHGSKWLICGMVMKFWKWVSTEKQKYCRPWRAWGCWELVRWCKRITRTLNLDLLNKEAKK